MLLVRVFQIFVFERPAVDAVATGPVSLGDVPRLRHETLDHSVELAPLITVSLSFLDVFRLLSGFLLKNHALTQSFEILNSFWMGLIEELDLYSALGLPIDRYFKECFRRSHFKII